MTSRHPRLAGRPDRELPSLFESALFYRLRSPLGNLCPFFQHEAPFPYLTIGRLSRKVFLCACTLFFQDEVTSSAVAASLVSYFLNVFVV